MNRGFVPSSSSAPALATLARPKLFAATAIRGLLWLPLLLATAGCVSSGRYQELEAAYGTSQGQVESQRARITRLERELAQLSTRSTQLEGTVAEKDRALAELRKRQAQAQKRIASFRELTDKFRTLVDAGKLRVRVDNGRMVVQMQTDVLFASGSAALSRDGRAAVAEVSGLLASLSERRYQVEGHTDDQPIATRAFPSNWELAAARAINVVKVMTRAGLNEKNVSAVSYGDTMPIADNDAAQGRSQNRRIEIVLVPDLSSLPGAQELEKIAGDR